MLRADRESALALADRIVKNTYRTLMTRGMKGCFVYCTDKALADYLRSRLAAQITSASEAKQSLIAAAPVSTANVIPFPRVSANERATGVPVIPLIELRFAAGAFSDFKTLEDGATDWVSPPDWIRPQPGHFIAQVVGESMNRRIPNGAWCLFRAHPQGTRQGKVVVVEHRRISDPDTGGSYTVKLYSSEKVFSADGEWHHQRVTLSPDSDRPEFEPIVIEIVDSHDELRVAAELIAVLER